MLKKRKFSLEEACKSANYLNNLQEIAQTHPCESARTFGMSIISIIDEEYEKSLEYLELLAQNNPNITLLHQRIAEFCIDMKKYEQAIVHLEKVIELENQNLTARVWLCLMYYAVGEIKKATKSFEYIKEFVYKIRIKTRNWRED